MQSINSQNIDGVWPVMLTPFTTDGKIDYYALEALLAWYEKNGVDGLFAVCQSSEIFYLSLRERVELVSFITRHTALPVIASGHTAYDRDDQVDELKRMAAAGAEAIILITNRLAEYGSAPDVWKNNLDFLLNKLDAAVPLGFYECPFPYKRLITLDELKYCSETGRFLFLKDTCCDLSLIHERLRILQNSGLRLFNANTTTLLDSLKGGAAGFSGVMANFHPDLYVWLCHNWRDEPAQAKLLQAALTLCSQIDHQLYPVNAKAHLQARGLPVTLFTRAQNHHDYSPLIASEVEQMEELVCWVRQTLSI